MESDSHRNDVVLLYAHPSMHHLAGEIAECCTNGYVSKTSSSSAPGKRVVNADGIESDEVHVVENKPVLSKFSSKNRSLRKPCSSVSLFYTSDYIPIQLYPNCQKVQRMSSVVTNARCVEFRNTIQWKKFADGFPNLFIEDVKYMAGKDVIFIGSFHTPEVVFEQLSVLYAFPRYLAKSFHFILPYFPTGTMERVDTEGQIATAKTLATLLSSIPLSAKGPAQIIIYDIHALQERFYFSDNVIPRLETAIPLLQHALHNLPDHDNLMYAFPDDGAYKRFHLMFSDDESKLIICSKKRVEGGKRIVTVKDGNPSGKHVVIVDDLIQTGGTLRECGKALLQGGASKVSAYVTHAVFPNDSWKNFTEGSPRFEHFWITNSIPHAEAIAAHPPFRLLSLSTVIAENLLGFDLVPS